MLLALSMASCNNKDNRMLTIIHKDGTCSREYSFHTTQQKLMIPQEEDFDSIIDKSWERNWSILGKDSVRYPIPLTESQYDSIQELDNSRPLHELLMIHVKKRFETVQDMSSHLYGNERSHLVKLEGFKASSKLEKHFKWFYTDYSFAETFVYDGPAVFPIPISRFLSPDTVSYWFTGQPDLTRNYSGAELKEVLDGIDAKVSQWVNANWFTELCNDIINNYDKVQNPPVSKERFIYLRDSLAMLPAILNAGDNGNESRTEDFSKYLEGFFQSDAYTSFLHSDSSEHELQGGYEQFLAFNTTYDLMMPGRVTDSGHGAYDGQVIHYRITGERFIPADYKYTIAATSRVTNVWAFIVTFLVIILTIGSFFYRKG